MSALKNFVFFNFLFNQFVYHHDNAVAEIVDNLFKSLNSIVHGTSFQEDLILYVSSYLQLISRILKFSRAQSHPERSIGLVSTTEPHAVTNETANETLNFLHQVLKISPAIAEFLWRNKSKNARCSAGYFYVTSLHDLSKFIFSSSDGVVALKKKRSLETNLLYFKSQSILCIIADMEKFLCGDCGSISGGASSDGSSGNNRSISSGGSSSSSGSGSDSNDVSGSSNGNSIYCGAFVALDNEDDTFRRALDMLIYIICSTSGNGEDRSLQVRILKRCSALVVQILKCLLSQPQDGSGGGSSSGSGGGSSSGGSGGGGRSSSKKCSRLFFVDGFTREDCDSWIAYGIRCLVTVADSCLSVFQQQDASPHVAGDAMDGAEEDQMMINTIVAVVEFLVDDCFLLAARPSIYSVAAQLTSNDQDMVSFCCTLLKLQLRLEHTEAAISRTDYTETCTSKPARRAQLEVLRGAVHRALEVMAALGFTDVRVFLVFVECVASFDASVVLDLLSNSETVALEYLLRVSKRLLSENRESLAGNLAHLHPYRRDYLANHPHLRVETNRNRNDTGSVDGRATKGKVVVWMKGEESVPINSTCAGVQEDSDDGAGGGVSYRVSKYEWDRDAADQVRSADDALPVAGPTTLDEWIQFLRDLTDTLSSPSTRRSLPFDPTLFVKRLKIILQNIGD